MDLPHQIVEQRLKWQFDQDVRRHFFRALPTYVLGSDPVHSREDVERSFAEV